MADSLNTVGKKSPLLLSKNKIQHTSAVQKHFDICHFMSIMHIYTSLSLLQGTSFCIKAEQDYKKMNVTSAEIHPAWLNCVTFLISSV